MDFIQNLCRRELIIIIKSKNFNMGSEFPHHHSMSSENRGSFAHGTLKGGKHRKYTDQQRKELLTTFETDYHGTNISQFCRDKSVARLTMRGWLANKDKILSNSSSFTPDRSRKRQSIYPELDTLLYDWFLDHRKRFGTIPVSRQILLERAVHFKKLLQLPLAAFRTSSINPTEREPDTNTDATESREDFLFTPDMFVDDESSLQTPDTSLKQKQTSPITSVEKPFIGFTNPCTLCFLNATIQQLHALPHFLEEVTSRQVGEPDSIATKLLKDMQKLFSLMSNRDSSTSLETIELFDDVRDPDGNHLIPGVHYDAAQFFDHFITCLDSDIKDDSIDTSFRGLLSQRFVLERICPLGHITQSIQHYLYLTIPLANNSSLIDALHRMKYGEYVGKYTCPHCQPSRTYHGQAIERVLLESLPAALILQLGRFTFLTPKNSRKDCSYFSFPDDELLDLNPYLISTVTAEEASYSGRQLYLYIKAKMMIVQREKYSVQPTNQAEPILIDEGVDLAIPARTLRSASKVQSSGIVVNAVEAVQAASLVPAQPTDDSQPQLPDTSPPVTALNVKSIYHLQGVIGHQGSLSSGHYISYLRAPQAPHEWYELNDREVECLHSFTLPADLLGSKEGTENTHRSKRICTAYILVYVPGTISRETPQTGTQLPQSSVASHAEKDKNSSDNESEDSQATSMEPVPLQTDSETIEQGEQTDIDEQVLGNWLTRWINRRGIRLKVYSGEAGSADQSLRKRWLESTFKDILRKFNPCDIWNADEAGLFYTQISKKTYCQASEKPQGGKLFKHRSSILFAASLTGEKRRPLIIYKAASLSSVMMIKKRPYDYFQQPSSWMTLELFEKWLEEWNMELQQSKRFIALIVDGCRVHRTNKEFSNISLIYLPPCQTSIMQPMDQGIIRSFKAIYRSLLLRLRISTIEANSSLTFRFPTYVSLMCRAWKKVGRTTIINCFKAAGWMDTIIDGPHVLSIAQEKNSPPESQTSNADEVIENKTTPEEQQATETIRRSLQDSHKESATTTETRESESEDEVVIEVPDENAKAFEDFSSGEKDHVLQILGFQKPEGSSVSYQLRERKRRSLDEEEASESSNQSEPSDEKIHQGLIWLEKFVKKLPESARRDLYSRMVSSLQSDLQKKSDIITTHEKESPNLIQTTLVLSPVKKKPPEE